MSKGKGKNIKSEMIVYHFSVICRIFAIGFRRIIR